MTPVTAAGLTRSEIVKTGRTSSSGPWGGGPGGPGRVTPAHLLCVSLVGRGPAQVLGALLDLQLLADLPADPLALLVQELLDAGVREVRVLVQTELLQNGQPSRVTLGGGEKKNKTDITKPPS